MSGVRFALLGTLILAGGAGDPVAVSGARQRALLASLLLSANVPVSSGALAEAVWDGSPPPGAAATLRSHIRRLRQALGPQAGARITACDPGYLISVREPELDVLRFGAACADAGAARRRRQEGGQGVVVLQSGDLGQHLHGFVQTQPRQVLHPEEVVERRGLARDAVGAHQLAVGREALDELPARNASSQIGEQLGPQRQRARAIETSARRGARIRL